MRKTISIFAALALLLAFTATAYAQSSVQGYNDEAGQVQSDVEGNGTPSATTDTGGSLPFTGFDLALLAAAGGVLTAAGFGMRRLTRAPSSA